jgi:dienelactone hydrolase
MARATSSFLTVVGPVAALAAVLLVVATAISDRGVAADPAATEPAPPYVTALRERLARAARSPESWRARREEVRTRVLVAAGLWPEFERPKLAPVVFGKVEGPDYTIERVDLETLPGFHLTGNLFRPKGKSGPFPAVLNPHGHWKEGRFTQETDGNLPARGVTFARLGFVAFLYDMVGYGDFQQVPHKFDDPEWGQGLLGVQTWNSLRALDFVAGLPDVDAKRIGVSGASGGGTQTFLLTAIDDRVAAAAPVNMVAAEFQGGCTCENAPFLRIGLNNVEIAGMTAPRPLLVVAATGDWTKNVPRLEAPILDTLFRARGAADRFRAVQFNYDHNDNQDSRQAVYAWMAQWLQGQPPQERIPEPPVPTLSREDLTVWTRDHPLPPGAVDAEGLRTLLRGRVQAQLDALQPRDAPSLRRYRELMAPAWRHTLTVRAPEPPLTRADEATTLFVAARAEEAAPFVDAAAALGVPAQALVFGKHEVEPAAGGDEEQRTTFPATFYRTELARRVQDVVDAVARVGAAGRGPIRLVGIGEAGWPVLLSRTVTDTGVPVTLTVADLSRMDGLAHPGLRRLGSWQGAAMLAPSGTLVLHGAAGEAAPVRAAYAADGRADAVTVSEKTLSLEAIAAELQKAR